MAVCSAIVKRTAWILHCYTIMKRDTTVQLTLLVDAAPEVIWNALTDPQLTKLYLEGLQVRGTWEIGSPLLWVETIEGAEHLRFKGQVMASLPGRRLRYTRLAADGKLPDEPGNYTTVDISFSQARHGHTRVELWHGDFAGLPQDVRRARAAGRLWVEALVGLKRVSEEQQALRAA
jgi:uncharacterized protein YndB with AHSA1/START domain